MRPIVMEIVFFTEIYVLHNFKQSTKSILVDLGRRLITSNNHTNIFLHQVIQGFVKL
jgi:hypothetical protein